MKVEESPLSREWKILLSCSGIEEILDYKILKSTIVEWKKSFKSEWIFLSDADFMKLMESPFIKNWKVYAVEEYGREVKAEELEAMVFVTPNNPDKSVVVVRPRTDLECAVKHETEHIINLTICKSVKVQKY